MERSDRISSLEIPSKTVTSVRRPKMKRDPWVNFGLFIVKRQHFTPASLFIFGRRTDVTVLADCWAYTHFLVNFAVISKVKYWLSSRYPKIVKKLKKILMKKTKFSLRVLKWWLLPVASKMHHFMRLLLLPLIFCASLLCLSTSCVVLLPGDCTVQSSLDCSVSSRLHCKYLNARSECNDIVISVYSHFPLNPNAK